MMEMSDTVASPPHRELDPTALTEREQYRLMHGLIVPRPIALVTTQGDRAANAAPFSLFNIAGSGPSMVYFAVGDRDSGAEKDTIRNLRHIPEFVIHIVNRSLAEQMNICATNFPPDVNELEKAGLTTLPSQKVTPPRIAESPVHFECRVMQMIDIGTRHHVVLGEVLWVHCRTDVMDERMYVDFHKLDPVARLSGSLYGRITETFALERPII